MNLITRLGASSSFISSLYSAIRVSSDKVEVNGAKIIERDEMFLRPEFCVLTSSYSAKGSVTIRSLAKS